MLFVTDERKPRYLRVRLGLMSFHVDQNSSCSLNVHAP